MNSDLPLGPQRPNSYAHATSNSVADALLLEELIRHQRQEQELRAHLLASSTTAGSGNPYLGLPTTAAEQPLPSVWNLPPLPRDNATLAATTLSSLHLHHDDSLVVAQMLRNQQQQKLAANTNFRGGETTDPKALWLAKGGSPATLLHAGGSTAPSSSSLMHLADRVLPEPQKVIPTRLDVTTNDSSFGGDDMPAPLPKRKKKKRQSASASSSSSSDGDDDDNSHTSMPAPKKRKTISPLSAAALSPSTTFPLPQQDKAPVRETPKLISFQRTWGKLEKCKMRTELFRRRLERGQVHLTGVTRSVLAQARQRRQQQKLLTRNVR